MDNGGDSPCFCSICGASLRESGTFCSKCGASIGSNGFAVSRSNSYNYIKPKSNKLIIIGILSLAWGLYALYSGTNMALTAEATLNSVFSSYDPTFWDGKGTNLDTLITFITVAGVLISLSGIFALITAITSFFKRFYIVALVSCIISSVLALVIIIGIVGLIVAYFIHISKEDFKDANPIKPMG